MRPRGTKQLPKQKQKDEEALIDTIQVYPFAYLTLEPRETRWLQCRSPSKATENATGRDQQEGLWNGDTNMS